MNCTHHWIIKPANGASSTGICRYCGKEKQFRNSMVRHGPPVVMGKNSMDEDLVDRLQRASEQIWER